MSPVHTRRFCLLLVMAWLCLPAVAQKLLPEYVHDRWGGDRGFPGGTVQAVTETSDGYLWFGTEKGLTQFDGQVFRAVTPAEGSAPTLAPVLGLLSDDDGGVWIRSSGPKLLRYWHGKFDDVLWSLRREDAVTAMCQGGEKSVLIASVVNGVLRYRQGQLIGKVPVSPDSPFPVTAIAEGSDGTLWLGIQQHGVYRVTNGHATVLKGFRGGTVTSLVLIAGGNAWIATDRGLFRSNGNTITSDGVPALLKHARISAMSGDRRSNLWISTNVGLFRLGTADKGMAPNDVHQVSDSSTSALFEDRQGNIWTGHAGAIQRLKESKFTTFGHEFGFESDGIGPVFVDAGNRVWFGLADRGLYLFDKDRARQMRDAAIANDTIYAITGLGKDLWIGRRNAGLTHLSISNSLAGEIVRETFTSKNGLADDTVLAVLAARDGSVWAGTLNAGVSHWKGEHFENYSTLNGLASNSVSSIVETANGAVFVGTSKGLSAWSQDHWQTYAFTDSTNSVEVTSLFVDSEGVLWVGTGAGPALLEAHTLRRFASVPLALREPILGMAEDRQHAIWFVTANHLVVANRLKLLGRDVSPGDIRAFDSSDGLPSLEGARRDRPLSVDSEGRIWIATARGLAMTDPTKLNLRFEPTVAHIEGVSVDGNGMQGVDSARVPPGSRRVVFSYTGVNLSASDAVRFRYRLDPFDRDWSDATTSREAAYTNLPPGAYRFRVSAGVGAAALGDAPEASLPVGVDPMFWQTRWFQILFGIAIVGIAITAYRIRLHQISSQLNVRFEERLAERTRIARELHDTLLQSLHGLMFRFQAARNMLPGRPDEAMNTLDGAIARTEQAIVESRNAIQFLRSQGSDLLHSLSAVAQELSSDQPSGAATFRVIVEGEPQPLSPMIQEEVFPIARELLQNAFHHAHAKEIEAELHYGRDKFRLRIRDDGTGIAPSVIADGGRAGHWGLPGTRERAQRIGAHLDFWSELGAGTEVELTLAASTAYKARDAHSSLGPFRKAGNHDQQS